MAHTKKWEQRNPHKKQNDRPKQAAPGWVHVASGMSGDSAHETLNCFGVNLYDYQWEKTGRKVTVTDPLHHEQHCFPVYAVVINGKRKEFAFGEYCMCIYGLYARSY